MCHPHVGGVAEQVELAFNDCAKPSGHALLRDVFAVDTVYDPIKLETREGPID